MKTIVEMIVLQLVVADRDEEVGMGVSMMAASPLQRSLHYNRLRNHPSEVVLVRQSPPEALATSHPVDEIPTTSTLAGAGTGVHLGRIVQGCMGAVLGAAR